MFWTNRHKVNVVAEHRRIGDGHGLLDAALTLTLTLTLTPTLTLTLTLTLALALTLTLALALTLALTPTVTLSRTRTLALALTRPARRARPAGGEPRNPTQPGDEPGGHGLGQG